MKLDLIIPIVAFVLFLAAFLFLSIIHILLIPKDILDRDTKPRPDPGLRDTQDDVTHPEAQTAVSAVDETRKFAQSHTVSPGDSQ